MSKHAKTWYRHEVYFDLYPSLCNPSSSGESCQSPIFEVGSLQCLDGREVLKPLGCLVHMPPGMWSRHYHLSIISRRSRESRLCSLQTCSSQDARLTSPLRVAAPYISTKCSQAFGNKALMIRLSKAISSRIMASCWLEREKLIRMHCVVLCNFLSLSRVRIEEFSMALYKFSLKNFRLLSTSAALYSQTSSVSDIVIGLGQGTILKVSRDSR